MATAFKKIHWTEHSKIKMRQYGLSKSKVLGLLRKPERKEKGIVEGTVALMQTNKKFTHKTISLLKENWQKQKKAPGEIWLMYRDGNGFRNIISTWRYPGVSKPGDAIPVPEDIRQELLQEHGN